MVKRQSIIGAFGRILFTQSVAVCVLLSVDILLLVGCTTLDPDTSPNPATETTPLVLNQEEDDLRRCIWPPPSPSGMYTFLHLKVQGRRISDLQGIDFYLRKAIKAAGYSDFCYYAIPAKGFAIFTPLEEIDADGNRIDSGGANAPIYPGKPASITEYFKMLFLSPPETKERHYRAFAFYLTKLEWPSTSVFSLSKKEFDDWTKRGDRNLPSLYYQIRASNYHCYVAVYELSIKPDAGSVEKEFDPGGPNECRDQLQKAGLWQKLDFDK